MMTPLLAHSFAKSCSERSARRVRLANSISQGVRRRPPNGETLEFLSHRFEISQFVGATLASLKMQLASLRIRRVQFSVEKRVQDELPVRTGTSRAHAGFERGRRDHGHAHHVAER